MVGTIHDGICKTNLLVDHFPVELAKPTHWSEQFTLKFVKPIRWSINFRWN
ncbi:MAG: hypothetical protein Q8909_14605 [Bacteroidota bacterium]|nr:hypothetical protein [Bacteroidota bacterium]